MTLPQEIQSIFGAIALVISILFLNYSFCFSVKKLAMFLSRKIEGEDEGNTAIAIIITGLTLYAFALTTFIINYSENILKFYWIIN